MDTAVFNRPAAVVAGWYWLARSRDVRRGRVIAVRLLGRDLALYRGEDGAVVALDAYCAHMGAHLAEGRVEGNGLRCFFHRWKYEADGHCSDVPCLAGAPNSPIRVRSWPVAERHGLVWLCTGDPAALAIPQVPELAGADCDVLLAGRFRKRCHPNVVMINAIDEQHFASVHRLPGSILAMEPAPRTSGTIEFRNTGRMPSTGVIGRALGRFYAGPLTYAMSYWYGSTGTVTLGPDCLHLHLMFALRCNDDGSTDGQTLALTRRRRGPVGWLVNRIVLAATALAARYFAHGDTRVFETIRFDLRNPIPADRAVLAFIRHLEAQPLASAWVASDDDPPRRPPTWLRVAGTSSSAG